MNHVWGLFSHPDREMQVIRNENETVAHHYTHHVLLMAAVPVVCAFIGTTQIGWNFGDGTVVQLSWFTGLYLAILFYGLMLAGVAVMGRVIHWMARNYPQRPSLAHCMVFAGYVATPLFLSGIVALYPLVWLCALIASGYNSPLATTHGDRYDAEASLCLSVDTGGVRHNVRESLSEVSSC